MIDEGKPTTLDDILADYLEAVESGNAPSREALLELHPQLAEDLIRFLDDEAIFDGLVPPGITQHGWTKSTDSAVTLSPPAPTIVGSYKILSEIAQGGMGVVYKAQQVLGSGDTGRIVAIKMMRQGDASSEEERRRFQRESVAVAAMDHPDIIPLYEVGEHDGLPYFSMKHISGGDLESRRRDYRNRPRAIAELLLRVARAVEHAHQRGVLHRDLKPANILLDEDGKPWVSDFGLVKLLPMDSGATRDPSLTKTGTTIGTPCWMAPEQALGRQSITTAADVYSLGAVLYALLTGQRPFERDTPVETLMDVIENDPVPPHRLCSGVDRDLENIALKCLEKYPDARYPGAGAFADELQRYLNHEPIHARPLSRPARLIRWARRRPVVAMLSTLLCLSLLLGMGLVVWQRYRAEQQRELAQQRYAHVLKVVRRFCREVSQEQLSSVAGLQPLQRELLESGLAELRVYLKQHGNDPALQAEMAHTWFSLGMIINVIGTRDEAAKAYQKAVLLYRDLRKDHAEHHINMAKALVNLSTIQAKRGKTQDALKDLQQAESLWRDLLKTNPNSAEYQSGLYSVLANRANLYRSIGKHRKGDQSLKDASDLASKLHRQNPERPANKARLANVLYNQSLQDQEMGRAQKALVGFQRAKELQSLVVQQRGFRWDRRSLAIKSRALGNLLCATGKRAEGWKLLEEAQELLEALVRANPSVTDFKHSLAATYISMATAPKPRNIRTNILQMYHKALQLHSNLLKQDSQRQEYRHGMAIIHHNLGNIHHSDKEWKSALIEYEKAVAHYQMLIKAKQESVIYRQEISGSLNNLGDVSQHLNQWEKSIRLFQQAIGHLKIVVGKAPQLPVPRLELSRCYGNLARAYRFQKQPGQSLSTLQLRAGLWPTNPHQQVKLVTDFLLTYQAATNAPHLQKQCIEQAWRLLKQALENGYPKPGDLLTRPEISMLRKHRDIDELFKPYLTDN